MRPNDYDLHAIGVSLLNATASDKVEMMEETSKAISSDFIKKSHHLEKAQEENAKLQEFITHQRREHKARSVEINRLQGLLTQVNTEKGKLQSALNNVSSQLKGQETTRNVALKELQERDQEIQQLKAVSRDATLIQAQLREEIRLKGEYAQQLSDTQVMLSEGKSKFEAKLHEKEASLELAEKKLQDMEFLLHQEQDSVA